MKKLLIFPVILLCVVNLFAQTANNDQLKTAEELNREAVRLFSQQKFKEALEPAKASHDLYEKTAGKYDLRTARVLTNIAQIYLKLDERKNAKNAFEEVLTAYEKNEPLSTDYQGRYVSLLETTGLLEAGDEDDIEKGEEMLARAVGIREKLNGPDSKELAATLYALARVYLIGGKYEQAFPVIMRSIDIRTGDDGIVKDPPNGMAMSADCLLSKLGNEDEREALRHRFVYTSAKSSGPQTPGEVKRIQAGVINGKALSLPEPRYPAKAWHKGIYGQVKVQVQVNEEGEVTFACAVEGPRELHYVSEIAAYASRFAPTKLSGKPVKVSGIINYNFKP